MSDASDARPTVSDTLYAAILANPDDMDLRLRYADAIEPTDPDHAELIRAEIACDLAVVAGTPVDPELSDRAAALSHRLTPRLGAPVAGLVTNWLVRRGFAEFVKLPGADFLDRGAEIYRRVPVRHVWLTHVDPDLIGPIAASPLLARLTSLGLNNNPIGDDGLRTLLASPYLRQLRWLGLVNCGITPVGAELFAELAPRVLPDLRFVYFARNRAKLVPYGAGFDAVGGQDPIDVYVPEIAERITAEHGPLPWLDPDIAWRGGYVDFGQV
ncbi:TIGR02996 domain-containing protein [Solwaraspora sp. WMMA2065]|uniref:TIGR02996 domain-containing protein n=1 Tax=Solwaraspora sp. WMMA2065 TaxID=3015166 RepID=UPI00338F3C2A